ncbi:MAG TPA: MFS transporter [Syntrophus sp. (in: bacteria)]|nr:MAG: MFS transporter [Syntrophus sp. GWC2_56_31]HBB17603.1 MFS transporter [Syntrophus sp. (in: bacteria)]
MVPDLLTRARRYRWLIFWILAFGYILVYFHRLCPAVLALDIMRDLKTSGALTGFMAAAYFYPYAAMQLPAGLLSDSWGPRNTIALFFCAAFIGSLILGMSDTIFWAIIGRAMVGLGVAMLFVPTMKILAEWFHIREFAFMTGILLAMGGLGSLSAAMPLVWLSSWIGWRFSFVIVGIFTLILAILVRIFVRDRPADMGWPSPTGSAPSTGAPRAGLVEGIRTVLTCPWFWPLAGWFFFDCGIFFSFGGLWGGPYLMQIYGLSKAESGKILSMLAVGLIVGSPLLSFLSTVVFRARKPVIVLSCIIVLCLTGVLAFYTAQVSTTGLYLLYLGFGMFSSSIVVIGFTTAKELFPVQIAGTATGLINLFPITGGAIFQPLLGFFLERQGRMGDAFTLAGYKQAFLVLFLSGIVALGASLFIKETMVRENT